MAEPNTRIEENLWYVEKRQSEKGWNGQSLVSKKEKNPGPEPEEAGEPGPKPPPTALKPESSLPGKPSSRHTHVMVVSN